MTPILEDPPIHELDHERIDELEERAERTDIRDGLSLLLSVLAAGAAITAIGLVIAFNGGDDEQIVTQAPAAAGTAATGAAHDHSTHALVQRRRRGVQAARRDAAGAAGR